MSFHELRIALRHLLKSPGFTTTAVLMLALGIGATTAIFSIVEAVLLRPLPFPHPERLVVLSDILQGAELGGTNEAGVTAPDIRAYTRDTHSFENLGGYQRLSYELSGIGEPAQVNAARLSGGVFPALGVAPLMGRFFTQQEDDGRERVTVVSYRLWQSRLHGDAHVLGSKILLNRRPYIMIGVMPRDFEFPLVPGHLNNNELWVPMSFTKQELTTGAAGWNFDMVGRLKAGITPAQAPRFHVRLWTSRRPHIIAAMRLLATATLLALVAGCSSGLSRPVREVTARPDADGVQRVRVVAHSYWFEPNRVVVKAGMPVELTVKNAAFLVPHNFSCFDKDAGLELSENLGMFRGQKRVRFTPTKAGEYEFFCHVGSHAKKGMKGKLVVVE